MKILTHGQIVSVLRIVEQEKNPTISLRIAIEKLRDNLRGREHREKNRKHNACR